FVVGTTGGAIVHGSRFDKKLGVKAYRRGGDYGGGGVSAVTSLAFHPTLSQYFLAGYADGSLRADIARTCRPSIAIAGASSKPLAIHELWYDL
ncbi:hypothetical protein DYB38_008815, partial [Aphanomyces astaci]